MRTPAGRPWRVITISCRSASRRYRERSSFTLASATRFAWGPRSLEPLLGLRLEDDDKDFDDPFRDVIEHPYLVNTQAVLRSVQPAQPLDAAPTFVGSWRRWRSMT